MNKERGYYVVIYTCLNCGEKLYKDIPYGQPIRPLVEKLHGNPLLDSFVELAPECEFCGCKTFGDGKADRSL